MRGKRRRPAFCALLGLTLASCTSSGTMTSVDPDPTGPAAAVETRDAAYRELASNLDEFRVKGAVRTSEGLLLPEEITILVRSEICVESREPGSRFWSLDYDTCFVYAAVDTVDAAGEYTVSVPCLDADKAYESKHSFGELRLVPRGPVSFLAESDAGWRHQETFSSSRNQRRDLILELDPETFWVVQDVAVLQKRPLSESPELERYRFGTGIEVVRFHNGWAQCVMDGQIGWMEMRFLGTELEMKEAEPVKGKPDVPTIPVGDR